MAFRSAETTSVEPSSPSNACLIYCTPTEKALTHWVINAEASQVLCGSKDSPENPGMLCARWKARLDQRHGGMVKNGDREVAANGWLDLYVSGRRSYGVRVVLLGQPSVSSSKTGTHYLFLLERIVPDGLNFPKIAREWKLCPQEVKIVQLILLDHSNKEIALRLNLSLHTVKGYLRLLMRKLGVKTRAGVLACVLTKRPPRITGQADSTNTMATQRPKRKDALPDWGLTLIFAFLLVWQQVSPIIINHTMRMPRPLITHRVRLQQICH